MELVLFIVAIVLFAIASLTSVTVRHVHLGWLGMVFLTCALLVGSGLV